MKKLRKGAASFYIVAFSTLILVVIATSFAMVIMSEIARTANDDLSQSAYDSALAGIEDAKVAYASYRRCAEAGVGKGYEIKELSGGSEITCSDIIYWMRHPDCYMVGHILGKIPKLANVNDAEFVEVTIGGQETTGTKDTTTNQAYTCVKIDTELNDYRSTLTAQKRIQTMRASTKDENMTKNIKSIKLKWYSKRNDVVVKESNFQNFNTSEHRVSFPFFGSATMAIPPTVELQIVQTADYFTMDEFDRVDDGRTNRGTLYLVPTPNTTDASEKDNDTYIGVYNGEINFVSAGQVVKTNDHKIKNRPFAVYCKPDDGEGNEDEFYCLVEVELPEPIDDRNSGRNNDTFMISVSLPYQQPDTDFAIELCSESGCSLADLSTGDKQDDKMNINIANSQISIDSTGRANDLYRRVEARLETADTTFRAGYPYYALQITGKDGDNNSVLKEMKVEYEKGFYF